MSSNIVETIKKNNVEELAKLIKSNPNGRCNYSIQSATKSVSPIPMDNLGLMHIAAYYNSTECLTYLYDVLKMDINAESANGLLPIQYACLGGSTECAYTIFDILEEKSKDGKNEIIKTIFEKDYSDEKFSKNNLPYLATQSASKDILVLLFEKGYDFEKYQPTQKRFTNLSIENAIKTRNVEALEILLRYLKPSKTSADFTPLMLAIINNQTTAIPLLLKTKCEPEARTKDNKTALSLACFQGNYEAATMIANVLVDVDIPSNIAAPSAVHWICQARDPKIAEIVLSKGINVNRLDQDGHQGPFYMLDVGQEDEIIQILDLLFKYGFNVNLHSRGKNTILGEYLMAIKRQYKIIDWLLSKGADTSYPIMTIFCSQKKAQTIGDLMRQTSIHDKKMKELVDKYL